MIIGHYHPYIWSKGGIASYIRRISEIQKEAGNQIYFFSKEVYENKDSLHENIFLHHETDLFRIARQKGVDILHLHSLVSEVSHDVPCVRTLHGHQPYCPSGSRFLGKSGLPCNRPYSLYGCLWGHFADRCGSLRPQNVYQNFQRTQQERNTLPSIPVITVSEFLKQQMVRSGYPEHIIQVLYLFAPTVKHTEIPLHEDIPRFVFLGRISPEKGLKWLVEAFDKVQVPCHLDIAGEGYQEQEIKQFVHKLDLQNRLTFHGWVSPSQASELIRSSRAVIFPSLWHEPGGTVAFEAMAHARPVIMSKVGGMPEVILDNMNGFLVEPGDVNGLAKAIEQLAGSWSLAVKLGEAGMNFVEREFSLEKHFQKLMSVYAEVIALNQLN